MNQLDATQFFATYLKKLPEIRKRRTTEASQRRNLIYAADGKVVRTFGLGHQPVGTYQDRSRAAYWDGRNELGEPVASGLYLYTLTAGNFTATRKMVIMK